MVTTRKSLGALKTLESSTNVAPKRRSLENPQFPRVYPVLTETMSFAPTIITSEVQEDDEDYDTEADSSFASSISPEKQESFDWRIGFAVLAVLFFAIFVGFWTLRRPGNQEAYENYITSVRSSINSNYPSISKENRNLLRLIGEKIFKEPTNLSPLVIMIGGKNCREFSEMMSEIVRNSKENGLTFKKNQAIWVENETNRAELHENLKNVLEPSTSSESPSSPRTAVVFDVDFLKWDAVLVLHAFADQNNFPVPKTVLFLTTSSENDVVDGENCEEKMVNFLTHRWIQNGGSSDNIPPIIARISYFLCV